MLSGLDELVVAPSPTSATVPARASSTPPVATATSVLALPTVGTPSPVAPVVGTPSPSPILSQAPTLSPIPTVPSSPTPTLLPAQQCTHPANWIAYTVQTGDTVSGLSIRAGITQDALLQANCLDTSEIHADQQLFLPIYVYRTATRRPVYPTATSTPYVCGHPAGWVLYRVQPGDTLYGLSARAGATIEAVRRANCLTGDTLYAGRNLYLPVLPSPPTLLPTLIPSPTLAPAGSSTATSAPDPTVAPIFTFTSTPASTVTWTSTPAATPRSTPVHTTAPSPVPSVSATYTPEPPSQPSATWTPNVPHTPTETQMTPQPGTSTHTPTPTPWTIG